MSETLSQDEINALLGIVDNEKNQEEKESSGDNNAVNDKDNTNMQDVLSLEEKDILGEIGNISMGTSATTLFALLGKRVSITTPRVDIINWKDLSVEYDRPCVGIKVNYKEGLIGSNVLVLKQKDVKIITNLMMGGDGIVNGEDVELSEIDLSAIGEAMNQMVGSASTSISSMMKMKIDIDTPKAFMVDFNNDDFFANTGLSEDYMARISFRMEIENLIDSKIMQILPLGFAKEMVTKLKEEITSDSNKGNEKKDDIKAIESPKRQEKSPQKEVKQEPRQEPRYQEEAKAPKKVDQNVNVAPAQFQSFDYEDLRQQKENISIIMDVPLDVTVELGRTKKKIKDILEFTPGTILELDKIAGEPIDVIVNGKFVAKGEVVVIDENFGVRITDIINVENRI